MDTRGAFATLSRLSAGGINDDPEAKRRGRNCQRRRISAATERRSAAWGGRRAGLGEWCREHCDGHLAGWLRQRLLAGSGCSSVRACEGTVGAWGSHQAGRWLGWKDPAWSSKREVQLEQRLAPCHRFGTGPRTINPILSTRRFGAGFVNRCVARCVERPRGGVGATWWPPGAPVPCSCLPDGWVARRACSAAQANGRLCRRGCRFLLVRSLPDRRSSLSELAGSVVGHQVRVPPPRCCAQEVRCATMRFVPVACAGER